MGTCESTDTDVDAAATPHAATANADSQRSESSFVLEQDDVNGITYRILQPADVAGAIENMARAFSEGEPVTGQYGVTLKDMRAFCEMYVPRMAEQGHTVLAVDTPTGTVLGAFLCEDYNSPVPVQFDSFLEEADGTWGPLLNMLEELENHLNSLYEIAAAESDREAGKWLHLWMLGVLSEGKGRQIGKKLAAHAVLLAREQGFTIAFAECTGAASTKILTKVCGAQSAHFVDYAVWGDGDTELDALKELPSKGHLGMTLTINDLTSPIEIANINHSGGWKRRPWFRGNVG